MELKRILEDVEVEEVSLVDIPANLRKFFFIKRDEGSEDFEIEKGNTSISVDSDGTGKVTKVTINGTEFGNVLDFQMFVSDLPEGGDDQPIYCRYTVAAKGSNKGFKSTRTYVLAKAKIGKADWSTKYINNLPDSSFLWIEAGGKKDDDGKTVPRSLRHLPYKDMNGKLDADHVRAAAAAIGGARTGKPMSVPTSAKSKLRAAMKTLKIGEFKKAANTDIDTIKDFIGTETNVEINEVLGEGIAENVRILKEYQDAFPQEVIDSIKGIISVSVSKDGTEIIEKGEERMSEETTETTEEKQNETKQETVDTSEVAAKVAELLNPVITDTVKEQFAALQKEEQKLEEPKTVTLTEQELEDFVTENVEAALGDMS